MNVAGKGLMYMGGRKNRGRESGVFVIFRIKATEANYYENI